MGGGRGFQARVDAGRAMDGAALKQLQHHLCAGVGAVECYAVLLLPVVETGGDAAARPPSEGGEC